MAVQALREEGSAMPTSPLPEWIGSPKLVIFSISFSLYFPTLPTKGSTYFLPLLPFPKKDHCLPKDPRISSCASLLAKTPEFHHTLLSYTSEIKQTCPYIFSLGSAGEGSTQKGDTNCALALLPRGGAHNWPC